jgi:hypothetical protein
MTSNYEAETDQRPPTNVELRVMVETLVELHTKIKAKSAEVKTLNVSYKALSQTIKDHMRLNALTYIDMKGHQVHTYARVRPPAVDEDFLVAGLEDFFKSTKMKMNYTTMAANASAHLLKRKKEKVGGTEVWTMTMRNVDRAKAKQAKKRKRNHDLVEDDAVDNQLSFIDDEPLDVAGVRL